MHSTRFALLLSIAALLAAAAPAPGQPLLAEMTALDAKVFDAYNRCDLDTFGRYFDPNVAFFHDTGGATFDRATVLNNTRKYICSKVRRELLPTTLRVYPVKDNGAIEEGEHRFCELATGKCEGVAKFVIVWARTDNRWRITNVLSYRHRALSTFKSGAAADGLLPNAKNRRSFERRSSSKQ